MGSNVLSAYILSLLVGFHSFQERESKNIMKPITEKEVARPTADSEENFNLFFES